MADSPAVSEKLNTRRNQLVQTSGNTGQLILVEPGNDVGGSSKNTADIGSVESPRILRAAHQISESHQCNQSLINRLFDVALLTTDEKSFLSFLAIDDAVTEESDVDSPSAESTSSDLSNELFDCTWIDWGM
jgi:hypothetical protein